MCKPPPETKRPPRLMQTPCAFVQTSTFYTNPLTEVNICRAARIHFLESSHHYNIYLGKFIQL